MYNTVIERENNLRKHETKIDDFAENLFLGNRSIFMREIMLLYAPRVKPGGGEEIRSPEDREEIELNMKNENLKFSLFLGDLGYFSLFSCHL